MPLRFGSQIFIISIIAPEDIYYAAMPRLKHSLQPYPHVHVIAAAEDTLIYYILYFARDAAIMVAHATRCYHRHG